MLVQLTRNEGNCWLFHVNVEKSLTNYNTANKAIRQMFEQSLERDNAELLILPINAVNIDHLSFTKNTIIQCIKNGKNPLVIFIQFIDQPITDFDKVVRSVKATVLKATLTQ